MIKLGHIVGYNSINVPKFAKAVNRDTFFDSYVDYTIDAYYPPFYTNVIKLDINEVPQTAPINFVILVHNNKYYYYFVDKINYINEDIYEIIINMDTLLTYMFDYDIHQGLITRKSIKRWNGTEINRDYVRENMSEGIMEVSSFTYRNPNKYIIVASSHNYVDNSRPSGWYFRNGVKYNFGYYVYVFPLPPFDLSTTATIHMYDSNGNRDLATVNPYDVVNEFIDDPYTINMMLVESEYLDKVYGTTWREWTYLTECSVYFTPDITTLNLVRINGTYIPGFNINKLDVEDNLMFTDILGFTKNTTVGQLFNYLYVPQLIDENYIQLEYGDVNGFSSYPLHQSKSVSFNYYNNLDVTNGNDGYYILDSLTTNNKYNSYNISLGLTFDLITDPWKQYQAQNKGTLSTGLQLQAVNTLYSTAKGLGSVAGGGTVSSTNSLRTYFNMEKHTASVIAKEGQSVSAPSGSLTPISDGIMQGINIVANYQINKDNLQFSPDTVKGRANLYSMMFSKYKSPYLKKSMVNDIINCAKKLEEFGYRVNEVFEGSSKMHNICNNRYYYNFLAIRVKSYQTLCFIPNEIINDINARLELGVRFINTSMLGEDETLDYNFRYDNVEIE